MYMRFELIGYDADQKKLFFDVDTELNSNKNKVTGYTMKVGESFTASQEITLNIDVKALNLKLTEFLEGGVIE